MCLATTTPFLPLAADMQNAQLLMVAGFVMLGWVLARRQLKNRKRVNQEARSAKKALTSIRERSEPAIPLCDAPPETQRWQVALFDLQRELKAELDTRIVVVQSLMRQMDERIRILSELQSSPSSIAGEHPEHSRAERSGNRVEAEAAAADRANADLASGQGTD